MCIRDRRYGLLRLPKVTERRDGPRPGDNDDDDDIIVGHFLIPPMPTYPGGGILQFLRSDSSRPLFTFDCVFNQFLLLMQLFS